MNILGIIPARAGSKRVPDKNIRPFAGKPLIHYVLKSATQSLLLNRIVVSSDCPEVLEIAGRYGNVIALPRPSELATDTSPAIDYVRHTLDYLQSEDGDRFDMIVILQPSSPLTLASDIDTTIQLLMDSAADTAVSVVELSHMVNPLKLKVLDGNRLLPYLEDEEGRYAKEDLPNVYVRNCAVYATWSRVVDQGKIIGPDCRGYLMPFERSVDINDMIDFDFAEFLYKRRISKHSN